MDFFMVNYLADLNMVFVFVDNRYGNKVDVYLDY